ncbi:MAG: hypothetical protein RBT51_14190 [Ectothiorhodospiraceae bacterium]|jgi:hypothetical protein|nr:hypothetical protein [Ectothiorhodospiraceae bacterium]
MKLRHLLSHITALALAGATQAASAQVIITYSDAAGVPISSWVLAIAGISMSLLAFDFLRKRKLDGVALLALGTVCLGSAALYSDAGLAFNDQPDPYPMTASPADIPERSYVADYSFPYCGEVGYVWVSNGAGGEITITDIAFDTAGGYSAFDPDTNVHATNPSSFAGPSGVPECLLGTALSGAQSCVVWYHRFSTMC